MPANLGVVSDYELVNELSESARAWVDPSNVEQLAAWDGDAGAYWAARADRFDEGVAGYREQFLAAAAIDTTATVLDVGCGSGQVTRDAARCAAAGSAIGVDLSSRMIELARQRADGEQVANVAFHQADAQIHPFPDHRFTIVISRHGAMFFHDAPTAFTNIARAMHPGGRLVLLTWQPFERNEWQIAFLTALAAGRDLPTPTPGPFPLNDPDRVRPLLRSAGFEDVAVRALSEPMYFGPDPDDAFRFISGQHAAMVRDLDADTRNRALDNLRASVGDHQTERGVYYDSAAWLIEARRSSPPRAEDERRLVAPMPVQPLKPADATDRSRGLEPNRIDHRPAVDPACALLTCAAEDVAERATTGKSMYLWVLEQNTAAQHDSQPFDGRLNGSPADSASPDLGMPVVTDSVLDIIEQ